MTTTPDFRAELQRLVDLYEALGGNWSPHGYTDTWNDALVEALTALATPPPPPPTDEELLEIRDGAYCPGADEVNDENDSMWQYTSDYINWLYEHGTTQEQQEYEVKGLRMVFNAGRQWTSNGNA